MCVCLGSPSAPPGLWLSPTSVANPGLKPQLSAGFVLPGRRSGGVLALQEFPALPLNRPCWSLKKSGATCVCCVQRQGASPRPLAGARRGEGGRKQRRGARAGGTGSAHARVLWWTGRPLQRGRGGLFSARARVRPLPVACVGSQAGFRNRRPLATAASPPPPPSSQPEPLLLTPDVLQPAPPPCSRVLRRGGGGGLGGGQVVAR